jgi:hypothetical protein
MLQTGRRRRAFGSHRAQTLATERPFSEESVVPSTGVDAADYNDDADATVRMVSQSSNEDSQRVLALMGLEPAMESRNGSADTDSIDSVNDQSAETMSNADIAADVDDVGGDEEESIEDIGLNIFKTKEYYQSRSLLDDHAANAVSQEEGMEDDDEHVDFSMALKHNLNAAPSQRALVSTEDAMDGIDAKDDEEAEASQESVSSEPDTPPQTSEPTLTDILESTEHLFDQVEDKDKVTVKEILVSLESEFDMSLSKAWRDAVRSRLSELVSSAIQPKEHDELVDSAESDDGDVDDNDAGADTTTTHNGDDAVVDNSATRYTEEELEEGIMVVVDQVVDAEQHTVVQTRAAVSKAPKPPAVSKSLAKAAAEARKHAENLRKRRMAELKIQQEELAEVAATEQDMKRAELIAQKFDTNTDEQILKRVEQRLDLLQRLDEKRISVIKADTAMIRATGGDESKSTTKAANKQSTTNHDESDNTEDYDYSDDDMELEIVGAGTQKLPKLQPMCKDDPLMLLCMPSSVLAQSRKESPKMAWNSRSALRQQLLQKQRKMGNMWLARELGYDNEDAHIHDCLEVERKKLELTLKREEERRMINAQRAIRQRLIAQGQEVESDNEKDEEAKKATENKTVEDGLVSDKENKVINNGGNNTQAEDESSTVAAGDNEEESDDEEMDQAVAVEQEINGTLSAKVTTTNGLKETLTNAAAVTSDADNAPSIQSAGKPTSDTCKEVITSTACTNNNVDDDGYSKDGSDDLVDSDDEEEANNRNSRKTSKVNHTSKYAEHSDDGSKYSYHDEDNTDTINTKVDDETNVATSDKKDKPRNSAWQALLRKEAEQAKKQKKAHNPLLEDEAEEEEEEELAGLEDFGFVVSKKKNNDEDDEEKAAMEIDEEDLEHVVDDLSDNEGDEEAGEAARKVMQAREEKEKHKEILRLMREGYDGRRGGIAGGGARGVHRFDQLVAADNREDAKRLGLLNDDEVDSDSDDENKGDDKTDDEEEDEAAMLDKMLKDRFLHRSSVQLEENFSNDEDEQEGDDVNKEEAPTEEDYEEKEQERLARQFSKRARMQRLMEEFGESEEFAQSRLIDEDANIKLELERMTVSDRVSICHLVWCFVLLPPQC